MRTYLRDSTLELTIDKLAERSALVGHHYEVSWCLWAAINWQLQFGPKAATGIASLSNSIVAIMALDANQRGLFGNYLNINNWNSRMTQDDLHEEEWLLAYEANVQGWLPSNGPADHVLADPAFRWLKHAGVRFYSPAASPFTPGALAYP